MLRRIAISCLIAASALDVAARTRPHYGGTLHIEVEGDPWQRPAGLARTLVLDGLTAMSVDGRPEPALAVGWKAENEAHRWQFRLRPGVHFHDGTTMNSANVAAALTAICGARCPWTKVNAVGSAVVFVSDEPLPHLPEMLAADGYRIALSEDAGGTGHEGSIGTGAFQFRSLANGVVTLAANESCWQGRPFVDAVEIRGHRAVRDQWLDLSVGRADMVDVPAEQLRQAHEQRFNVIESGTVDLLALIVSDTGAFGDGSLRSAIALAVDRAALSHVIYQKQGEITASLLPAEMSGYSFLFPPEQDLNRAREQRGGLSGGTLNLVAEGGAAMQLAAQRIALNLRDAGFNVQVGQAGAPQHVDLTLTQIGLEASEPGAALELIARAAGIRAAVVADTIQEVYGAEREIVETHRVIPLLYLPRAFAVGGRVRDLCLGFDGEPLVASASVEDAP